MTQRLLFGAVAITLSCGVLTGCATTHESGTSAKANPQQSETRRARAARTLARAKKSGAKYKIATRPVVAGKPPAHAVRVPAAVVPQAPPAARVPPVPQGQPQAVPPPAAPPRNSVPLNPAAPVPVPVPVPVLPPAPQPPDPLPTEPAPPPARPDPVPAPPNRANVTPPRQAGGGIAGVTGAARPEARPEIGSPPAGAGKTPEAKPRGGIALAALGSARIEEARRMLARGKVAEARSLLEGAVEISPAVALLELARTYDPYYLGMLPSINEASEPYRAAALYQDAILHGSTVAGGDLDRLRARQTPR